MQEDIRIPNGRQHPPPSSRRERSVFQIRFAMWCGLLTLTYSLGCQMIASLHAISSASHENQVEAALLLQIRPDEGKATTVSVHRRSDKDIEGSIQSKQPAKSKEQPDFGGLRIKSLKNATEFRRVIQDDPQSNGYHRQRDAQLATMDKDLVGEYLTIRDEWLSLTAIANRTLSHDIDRHQCRQNKLKYLMFPNCNTVHEISTDVNDRTVLG